MQGLPMTRGRPGGGRLFEILGYVRAGLGKLPLARDSVIKAVKYIHWLCFLTSDQELGAKVGKV